MRPFSSASEAEEAAAQAGRDRGPAAQVHVADAQDSQRPTHGHEARSDQSCTGRHPYQGRHPLVRILARSGRIFGGKSIHQNEPRAAGVILAT